jgi:membrane protease YdiL (CAAX protease family)
MKKHEYIIIKCAGFFVFWLVLISILGYLPVSKVIENNSSLLRFYYELLPLIVTIFSTFIFVKYISKNDIKIKLTNRPINEILMGILTGTVWICSIIGTLFLLKVLTIDNYNYVPNLLIWIAALLLNTIMQEYLVRGYVFSALSNQYTTVIAVVVTTVFFLLLHGGIFEAGIVAILNIISTSILFSLLLIYYKGLLVPIIVHFIWNLVGGIIVHGINLAEDYPSIFNITLTGNILLTGGVARIEGSVIVLVINIVIIGIFAFLLRKNARHK